MISTPFHIALHFQRRARNRRWCKGRTGSDVTARDGRIEEEGFGKWAESSVRCILTLRRSGTRCLEDPLEPWVLRSSPGRSEWEAEAIGLIAVPAELEHGFGAGIVSRSFV